MAPRTREELSELVSLASMSVRQVLVMPNLRGTGKSTAVAKDLAETFTVGVRCNLLDPWALRTKRICCHSPARRVERSM
jgi:hypothetical protein